jgi:hypothetical protein
MEKLIKHGRIMNPKTSKYEHMMNVRAKHNINCTLEDDTIDDYYADSKLGGAKIHMSFSNSLFFYGPYNNDPRISRIEFTLSLNNGFLSWLDIWKKIDDFITEHEIDRLWIESLNIYSYHNPFDNNETIIIKPFITG